MNPKSIAAWLLAATLSGCGPTTSGHQAYEDGRFEDAHAAFRRASETDTDGASAELLYNRALAALRAGDLADARSASGKAARRAEGETVSRCDFLSGHVAFAQCTLAEAQARTAGAEPFAFDVAITYAKRAHESFAIAAMSRPDWPEARRNSERALLKLRDLQKQKDRARKERNRKRETDPDSPKPKPQPNPKPEPDTTSQPDTAPQTKELSPEQILGLLDKLAQKERESTQVATKARPRAAVSASMCPASARRARLWERSPPATSASM